MAHRGCGLHANPSVRESKAWGSIWGKKEGVGNKGNGNTVVVGVPDWGEIAGDFVARGKASRWGVGAEGRVNALVVWGGETVGAMVNKRARFGGVREKSGIFRGECGESGGGA